MNSPFVNVLLQQLSLILIPIIKGHPEFLPFSGAYVGREVRNCKMLPHRHKTHFFWTDRIGSLAQATCSGESTEFLLYIPGSS